MNAGASRRVTVPATSANLGPGFDALGLALEVRDELAGEIVAAGLSVEVLGAGQDLPRDESHLVVRSMRAAFDRLGGQPPGLRLRCTNRIPHGRGLGSSAAAIVGGIVLARALVPGGRARLDDAAALALAADLEGHPDNVAAALLGGLTIAWAGVGAQAVRLSCSPVIRPVALVPAFTSSTVAARGLLPALVGHADAARNAGRAALLVAALTTTPQHLLAATEDRLHQQQRAPAMPASLALMTALRERGLPAVISGAGPTVLVLARDDDEVSAAAAAAPDGWSAVRPAVSRAGARVERVTG
ncbi:MAG: homoserine kinase [Jatrophihabitans sp.]|nr:MAG: homoserine kinase [Jatrophihabitans sp.]